MKKSGIYGIFNLANGKVLVGSTNNLQKRWTSHKNDARNGEHPNPHFQAAWNYYGEDSFEFRVLEECPVDMLIVRENAWMGYHNSLNRNCGYNQKNATQTIMTDDHKKKITAHLIGRKASDETKRKMSLARSGKKHWSYGRPMSEETKRKISEAKKGIAVRGSGFHLSEEHKKRLSEFHTGLHPSEKTIQKLRERMKGNQYLVGHKHTEESKKKMSMSQTGRKHSPETIAKIVESGRRTREAKKQQFQLVVNQ